MIKFIKSLLIVFSLISVSLPLSLLWHEPWMFVQVSTSKGHTSIILSLPMIIMQIFLFSLGLYGFISLHLHNRQDKRQDNQAHSQTAARSFDFPVAKKGENIIWEAQTMNVPFDPPDTEITVCSLSVTKKLVPPKYCGPLDHFHYVVLNPVSPSISQLMIDKEKQMQWSAWFYLDKNSIDRLYIPEIGVFCITLDDTKQIDYGQKKSDILYIGYADKKTIRESLISLIDDPPDSWKEFMRDRLFFRVSAGANPLHKQACLLAEFESKFGSIPVLNRL